MLAITSFLEVFSAGAMCRPERVNYRGKRILWAPERIRNPLQLTLRSCESFYPLCPLIVRTVSLDMALKPLLNHR